MCGILAIWNREGKFDNQVLGKMCEGAEKRGQDGFGLVVINNQVAERRIVCLDKFADSKIRSSLVDKITQGSLVMGIFRAQPETEVKSSLLNMQPIMKDDCVLIHNGTVANFVRDELDGVEYETEIDSEAIINAYIKFDRDMKKVMEFMVGGYAFVLYDSKLNRLYCVNDYKPLAIGYVKGKGFLVHSDLDVIKEVVNDITDCKRCGTNVWEDFYYHWQEGYTIREVDMDSGMERVYNFEPRFYHPIWNSKSGNKKELVLVSASGGIDSGLSAWIMGVLGYEVKLVHFNYGQKGEEVEKFGVMKLAEYMRVEYRVINQKNLFLKDKSMLVDKNVLITTGTDKYMKTTAAWVSNRNGVFLSNLVSLAEQYILSNEFGRVYIVSGMSNLSEEGFYPDNSEYFIRSFFESVKYSTIVGDRIKYVSLLQNIMKSEEWILGENLYFPFEATVSCDEPRLVNLKIELCNQCGSTQLSKWAAEKAGVKDSRKFYVRDKTKVMEKKFKGKTKHIDVLDVINRIKFIKEFDKQRMVKKFESSKTSFSGK